MAITTHIIKSDNYMHKNRNKLAFRNDINGLRAVAVIAVVLYHFNSKLAPGGFAGVDVFFVISGFLMTSIIIRGLEGNSFNLFKFYVDRANRIVPALTVLCVVLLVFGWFYLTPLDYQSLGIHAASSLGFFSNFIYWSEAGYFDVASDEKWLLHTWSLSVEWQFYILYPVILIVLNKFCSLKTLKRLLFVGTAISLILSVLVTSASPSTAFYLLPTRAWEMTIGGLAYAYPIRMQEPKKRYLEFAGLALILSVYFFASGETLWPSYFALLPVVGAYFVLIAHRQSSALTGNVVFQALGRWSYSIYLWHWPIVVLLAYFDIQDWWFLGIPCSVLLGWISYRCIESIKFKPVHRWSKSYLVWPMWGAVVVIISGAYVYKKLPNLYLYPIPETVLTSISRKPYDCFDKVNLHNSENVVCQLSEGEKRILAFGDSHLLATLPPIEAVAKANNISLFYTGFSGCPPVLGVIPVRNDQDRRNCKMLNERAVSFARENGISEVIMVARWTYYTEGDYSGGNFQYLNSTNGKIEDRSISIESLIEGLNLTLSEFADSDIDVVIMLQVPMQEDSPDKLFSSSIINGVISTEKLGLESVSLEKSVEFQQFTNSIIIKTAKKYPNVKVLDPTNVFCDSGNCLVGDETVSYYLDDDHLSTSGANRLYEIIKRAVQHRG